MGKIVFGDNLPVLQGLPGAGSIPGLSALPAFPIALPMK